jgi:trigger factor
MQVSVEKVGDFGRRLKVVVPVEMYQQGVHSRIKELSKTVSLNGFRHGKVPALVIEKRYGQQVRNEVTENLIRETLNQAVNQENLRPAMNPQVTRESGDGAAEFAYTATFDVLPEFGTIDVTDLTVDREVASVTEADIQRMIDTLRRQRMSFEPVQRPAAAGDYVAFEFTVQAGDTRIPTEGVERGLTAIGQNAVMPEIEQALIGMQAGESKTVETDFAADYRDQRLAGKHAVIEMTVSRVNEGVLPQVDDAFAKSFNIFGGVAAFHKEVQQNLERELGQALSARLRGAVVEKLLKKFEGSPVPTTLVTSEAQSLQRQAFAEMTERAKRAGEPVPPEPAVESMRTMAERRVLAGLLLNEIALQNGLRLDEQRVRTAMAAVASTYENPAEVVQLYQQDQRLLNNLRSRVMDEQVAEWIAGHAQVTTIERSFVDILQPGVATAG